MSDDGNEIGCAAFIGIVIGIAATLLICHCANANFAKPHPAPAAQAEAPEPTPKRFSESESYGHGVYFMRDEKTGVEYLVNTSGGFIKLEEKR